MRVLLDTHAFLWFVRADPKLDRAARQLIEDPDNERWLSVASLWEMAIKQSLGRLTFPLPFTVLLRDHVYGNGIDVLEITSRHLDQLIQLPFHHKDPFDRLLVAQAMAESIPILSTDGSFDHYDVQKIWKG